MDSLGLLKPQPTHSQHHETRPPFLSLPLEIRLQILRYLVLGEGKIYPQHPTGKWATQYHMRILETCSQLYEEASTVFYGENTTGYQCLIEREGAWRPIESCLSQRNLARIRHVEIAIYPWKIEYTAKALFSMLRYLLRTGCALRTLKLGFFISNLENMGNGPAKTTRNHLASGGWRRGRASAVDRLCALKVQQRVEVFLSTGNIHDGDEFRDFVDGVAVSRGWSVELLKYEVHKIPLTKAGQIKAIRTLYEWTWILLPTNKP